MSTAIVTSGKAHGGVSSDAVVNLDSTGGVSIAAFVGFYGGATMTVTDDKGNVFVPSPMYGAVGNRQGQWFYCKNATVGAGHNVTAHPTGSAGYTSLVVIVLSGTEVSAAVDQSNGAGSTAASQATGPITPTVSDEMLLAGFASAETVGPSVDSGFTIDQSQLSDNLTYSSAAVAHKLKTGSTTVENVTFTSGSGTASMAAAIISIKPPLAIATSSPLPSLFLGGSFTGSLAATGVAVSATWTHGTGLPPGMSISSAGAMSGTAITAGTYTFDVTATDTQDRTDTKSFTITINPPTHGKATVTVSVLGTVSGEVD
jgi:hypothetical protein